VSGPRDAILKRWHALTVSPRRARRTWGQPYWEENGPIRDIGCRACPKFSAADCACGVRFGSPLRKCSIAAIEAHLHDAGGEEVLEVGFGRLATARHLVTRSGGRWTGIDPGQPRARVARLGRGGYGHAAAIPFPDASFDRVFGIQTVEHWGQKANARRNPSSYRDCLAEIWRVLKPGGFLYLDAPIHFHGHEMFIMGDLQRIRDLFDEVRWQGLVMERWRRDFEPLEKYPPSAKVQAEWPQEIRSYPESEVSRVREQGTVWLLTISASKAP
jgi:SAM-dependent methyltransferase